MPNTALGNEYWDKAIPFPDASPEVDVYTNIRGIADMHNGDVTKVVEHLKVHILDRWRKVAKIPGFDQQYYDNWNRRVQLLETEIQHLEQRQKGHANA